MAVHSVSYVGLLVLAVLGLLLLGDVVLTVVLLARRGTRPAGIVLLVLNALMVPVAVAMMWVSTHSSVRADLAYQQRRAAEEQARAAARRLDGLPSQATLPAEPDGTVPARGAEKRTGVLPALGKSLVKGVADARVNPAPRPARQTTSVLEATGKAIASAVARDRKHSRPAVAGKVAEKPPLEGPSPPAKPDLAASDLRAEFEKWLAARSDAAVGQLRSEFEGWLASGGHAALPAANPDRPAWVDAEPGLIDGDYHTKVSVGPYATPEECDDALLAALGQAAADYAEKYLGPGGSTGLRLAPEYLREHLVAQTWEEVQMTDFGPDIGRKPMIRRYALVRFDGGAKDELRRQHRAAVVEQRLWYTGYGMAAVLGLLGLTFAVLKTRMRASSAECPPQPNPTVC